SEPDSIEELLLKGLLGDSHDDAPTAAPQPTEQSESALSPQRGDTDSTGLAPQKVSAEPAALAPQQGESRVERAPAPAPAPAPEPIPERAADDPLSPQDILQGVLDILSD
ncbi:MAG: hypothetical protein VCD31_09500, partial [Alphaproteobacteria bacterium]